MERIDFTFTDRTGKKIQAYKWVPASPIATVQVAHGMMEHARRYDDFARFLAGHDIAVYAADHRGHGLTAEKKEDLGYFADVDGWELVVENLYDLTRIIKEELPGKPLILLGHSMGSLLARDYAIENSEAVDGVVISGTTQQTAWLIKSGIGISKLLSFFKGRKYRSNIHIRLGYGAYNRPFKPNRTAFDWLSGDPDSVDSFVTDPLCGYPSTTGLYLDFFKAILKVRSARNIKRMRPELPVLILGGGQDPVGNNGKDLELVHRAFSEAGMKDLVLIIYPGGRHEMLNETDKEKVYADILEWIRGHVL